MRHALALAVRNDHGPVDPLEQPADTSATGRLGGKVGAVAFHQEHRTAQCRLALAQANQQVELHSRGRQKISRQHSHTQPDRRRGSRGHGAATRRVRAAQLNDRHGPLLSRKRPGGDHAVDHGLLRRSQRIGCAAREQLDDRGQPLVQVRHAD
jgi:hypothetical protein